MDLPPIETIIERSYVISGGVKSIVYKTLDKYGDSRLIIKHIPYGNITNISDIKREYNLSRVFSSKYVVYGIAYIENSDGIYLIFRDEDLIELSKRIPLGGMAVGTFLKIALQLTRCLAEIHKNKIVHLDINPSNIVVSDDLSEVKIIDFSLADFIHKINNNSTYNEIKGTLAYISPSQIGRTNNVIDFQSDLYSLGITFYHLLSGELPYKGSDAHQIIHEHLTTQAKSLYELVPTIPKQIDTIVKCLMNKDKLNRYLAADDLLTDLERCAEQWNAKQEILTFDLNLKKTLDRIYFPVGIVGRTNELNIINRLYSNTLRGESSVLSISGESGIGKTKLVNQLSITIASTGSGFFVQGKFDQLNKNISFFGIIQVMDQLIWQILKQDTAIIDQKKECIKKELGINAGVLAQLLPSLEQLIGKTSNFPVLKGIENQDRINKQITSFFSCISSKELPVVIVLDDMQWCDVESAYVLLNLVKERIPYFFAIVTFRGNEIKSNHILLSILKDIERNHFLDEKIELEPLDKNEVCGWINNILGRSDSYEDNILKEIYGKTNGNPFYIKTMLHALSQKGILFKSKGESWKIHSEKLIQIPAFDSVADLLIEQFNNLPDKTSYLLKIGSMLGSYFSMDIISGLLKIDKSDIVNHLKAAENSYMVYRNGDNLFFAHDKIQKLAYDSIEENNRGILHRRIGKLIEKTFRTTEKLVHLEQVVYHLNNSNNSDFSYIERINLANYNYQIGLKYYQNGGYSKAEELFLKGTTLLGEQPFKDQYELSFNLYLKAGETLLLNKKIDLGNTYFEKLLNNYKSPNEIVQIYEIQIEHFATAGKSKKSLELAYKALEMFDEKPKESLLHLLLMIELIKTWWRLRWIELDKLTEYKNAKKEVDKAKMKIMMSINIPSYFIKPYLSIYLNQRMFNLTLKKGIFEESFYGIIGYSISLCGIWNKTDKGYKLGKIGFDLLKSRFPDSIYQSKSELLYGLFIAHWREPFSSTIKHYRNTYKILSKTNDTVQSSFAISGIAFIRFYNGDSLKDILQEQEGDLKIVKELGKDYSVYLGAYWYFILCKLANISPNTIIYDGVELTEELLFKRWEVDKGVSLGIYYLGKLVEYSINHKLDQATDIIENSLKYILNIRSSSAVPISYFYSAYTYINLYKTKKTSFVYIIKAKKYLNRLVKLGKNSSNYKPYIMVAKADMQSVKGFSKRTLKLYEETIKYARYKQNHLVLSLAYEGYCDYLLKHELDIIEDQNIHNLFSAFDTWGAISQKERIYNKFKKFIKDTSILERITNTSIYSSTSNTRLQQSLDSETLSKVIGILSSQNSKDDFVRLLLDILETTANATNIAFIEKINDRLLVTASKNYTHLDINQPIDKIEVLPVSLISESWRTKSIKQLNDKETENPFYNSLPDVYKSSDVFSILCLPISRDDKTHALVFIENKLIGQSFPAHRLKFLGQIASQAAIAVENIKSKADLKAERDFLQFFIDNNPNGIVGLDVNGVITLVNPAEELLMGYKKEDMVGKNWLEVFKPVASEKHENIRLLHLAEDKTVRNHEITVTRKDGEERDMLVSSFHVYDSSGAISQAIIIGSDITEIKKAEAELIKAKEKAEESDRLKTAFVQNISHEIRTPMNGILGFTELLKDESLPHDLRMSYVNIIEKSSDRMLSIISDLVDISKIEAGQVNFTIEPTNIIQLIDELILLFKTDLKNNCLTIKVDCSQIQDNPIIHTDKTRLAQILSNIIKNAIKFSENSIIKITVVSESDSCVFSIEDQGIGIPNDSKEVVFERFRQVKREGKVSEGSGLGLAISKAFVEMLGGIIWFESEENVGTTFYFKLPLGTEKSSKINNH